MSGSLVRQVQVPSVITHLEYSHTFLVSGSSDGYVRIHDPRTGLIREGAAESVVKAHSSGIQGLQTNAQFVFTIGMSLRYISL